MVVIVSGRVRISLTSEDGREVTLTMLGPNEVLGEMTLLDGGECSADATAQEDCVVLTVERTQFLRLLRSNSELCLGLVTVLFQRLRRANAALEGMALQDLPTRLGRVRCIQGRHAHRGEAVAEGPQQPGRGIAGEGEPAASAMGG
jgi:CRP-like cAMP-binding protein